MATEPFQIGDSVMVKSGVIDPDTDLDIAGWQGRIAAIYAEATAQLEIRWDSLTLKTMPESVIAFCEERGLDWAVMGLEAGDVLPANPRDTKADVSRVKAQLEHQFGWLGLGGDQGRRIQRVVNSAASRREWDVFKAWHRHLETQLQFPFRARVSEPQRGPVRQGETVKVLDVSMLDDSYGTFVAVKTKQGLVELPLCDLDVTDPASPNRDVVDDYSVWFANR
jgi:Calcium binding